MVVFDLTAYESGEVMQRIIIWGRKRIRRAHPRLRFMLPPYINLVAPDCFRVSSPAVDLHILPIEWPVPRSLQNGNRLWIGKNHRRFIIHAGINLWLDLLGNSRYGLGRLPV